MSGAINIQSDNNVRFYNITWSYGKILKETKSFSLVLISNCIFNVNENDSSSLFYVKGKNDDFFTISTLATFFLSMLCLIIGLQRSVFWH